jgi:RNA recognition motif-containing protein
VGNLPYGADEDELRQHVVRWCQLDRPDDVEGVRIVRDRATSRCRGFGYVLLRHRGMVATALLRLPGTEYMKRPLRVTVCGRHFKREGVGQLKKATTSSTSPAQASGSVPPNADNAAGALRRILAKQLTEPTQGVKTRRARGEKKKPNQKPSARKAGTSKRTASQARETKLARKMQKRVNKGMGKNKVVKAKR